MARLGHVPYKYLVAVAFMLGLFMNILDTTITNVALPDLAREFNASTTSIQWIVNGYLLSLAVFIPLSGWAGDRFGTKRVFVFALIVFTAGSTLCGFAWSAESLVGFRVLQGVGGGMLTPVGTAMMFRAFPPNERAKASALVAIPAGVAPALGPILGGYLVEYVSWHWIFFINVPVGIAGIIFSIMYLQRGEQEDPGRLDIGGFLLSASGLAALVYGLSEAGSRGLGDTRVLLFVLAGVVLLAAMVLVELRVARPMIDVRLFKDRLFASSSTVMLVAFSGLTGALFLLPLLLQSELGLSPLESGFAMFPQAVGMVSLMPLASSMYSRIGPRRMLMAGMAWVGLSTFGYCLVGVGTEIWQVGLLMMMRGVGFAVVIVPLQAATFATISAKDTGRASAIFSSVQQVAGSLGVAILGTILTSRLAHHGAQMGNPATRGDAVLAFHVALFVAAVFTLVGALAAIIISDKAAAPSMGRSPAEGQDGEPAAVMVH
jgi:EmrB/QacA subfamily drug resistance transporter